MMLMVFSYLRVNLAVNAHLLSQNLVMTTVLIDIMTGYKNTL